jgi:hypothetical protein
LFGKLKAANSKAHNFAMRAKAMEEKLNKIEDSKDKRKNRRARSIAGQNWRRIDGSIPILSIDTIGHAYHP